MVPLWTCQRAVWQSPGTEQKHRLQQRKYNRILFSLVTIISRRTSDADFGAALIHQTRDVDSLSVWCWPSVCNADPTSNRQWIHLPCLLGIRMTCFSGKAWALQSARVTGHRHEWSLSPHRMRPTSPKFWSPVQLNTLSIECHLITGSCSWACRHNAKAAWSVRKASTVGCHATVTRLQINCCD